METLVLASKYLASQVCRAILLRKLLTPLKSINLLVEAPSVALHIPWDKVSDYAALTKHATELGVRLGTINSNTFQDDDYKLGSVCHPDKKIRQKAVAHFLECIEIMGITGGTAAVLVDSAICSFHAA